MRIVLAFIGAVAGAYVLGASFITNHVASNLLALGVSVPFSLRLEMMAHDLLGLASLYLPVLAVALLVGFGVAALVLKIKSMLSKADAGQNSTAGTQRVLAYTLAGGLAIFALNAALIAPFETHLIAATRTTLGLVLQVAAGAAGGWLFARLSKPKLVAT